jgi:hypothetical protein
LYGEADRVGRWWPSEDVAFHIERAEPLDIFEHTNPVVARQPSSLLRHDAFVEDEHTAFLNTIIASLTAAKEYLGEESTMKNAVALAVRSHAGEESRNR